MRFENVDYNVEWVLSLTEEAFVKVETGKRFSESQLRIIYRLINDYGRTNATKIGKVGFAKRNSAKPH
jgi:hypothetical protein